MPFKFKHVFKGPAKLLNEVGQSGVFGQRGDHFRVLGLKIPKDVVPIVKAAVVIAAVAIGGPALAASTTMTTTAATVVTSAVANAAVTGCSGGNESQLLKAAAVGGATALVGNITQAAPTVGQAVTRHVAGNAAVSLASGNDFKTSLVQAATSIPIVAAPTNMGLQYTASAVAGAMLNRDNPLRGALQAAALAGVANAVKTSSATPSKSSGENTAAPASAKDQAASAGKQSKSVKECTADTSQSVKEKTASAAGSISYNAETTTASVNVKPSGVSVTIGGRDAVVGASVSNKSVGVSLQHSDSTSSKTMIGPSDIYERGIVFDKQTTIVSEQQGFSNNNNSASRISSGVGDTIVQEAVGNCFASRSTVSSSISNDLSTPFASTTTSNQTHVNLDCVGTAMAVATVIVNAPKVVIPALLLSKL